MKFKSLTSDFSQAISNLFTAVFSHSEGTDEGRLIGELASALATAIDDDNILCYGALSDDKVLVAAFYTRLSYRTSSNVFMLAPVAVITEHQGEGIGQQLIHFGLNQIKQYGVDYVVTYGDPDYYRRVGFSGISEDAVRAPFKLSMPEGWLGQSLTGKPVLFGTERPRCVEQFNNAAYW